MTKDEALKMALETLEQLDGIDTETECVTIDVGDVIDAIKEALAQPKQEQKYRRGDRLICLETEEYAVIHISGTDRQWIKFTDSHIGVYTNVQVADLFELLPAQQEPVGKLQEPTAERSWFTIAEFNELANKYLAENPNCVMPTEEPVAWGVFEGNLHDMFFTEAEAVEMADLKGTHAEVRPLYTTPPQRKPQYDKTEMNCFVQDLYDKKIQEGKHGQYEAMFHVVHRAIEAAHNIKE